MDESYARAKATADRVIRAKGQSVSVVVSNANGFTRTFKTFGAVFGVDMRYVDKTNVLATDKRILLSAVGISGPIDSTSRLIIGGVKHAVVHCEPFAPGGDTLFFNVFVRS